MPIVSRSQWVADQLERRYWGFYKMNFRRINWNSNNILPLREKNGCNYVRSYSTSNKNRAGIFWKSPSVSQEKDGIFRESRPHMSRKSCHFTRNSKQWDKPVVLRVAPRAAPRAGYLFDFFLRWKWIQRIAWVRTINRLLVVERRSQEQGDIS